MIVLVASLLALAVFGASLARMGAAPGESRATTLTRGSLGAAGAAIVVQALLGAAGRLTAVHTLVGLGLLAAGAAVTGRGLARRRSRRRPAPPPPAARAPWSAAEVACAAALLALLGERLWHGTHASTFLYDTLSYHLHMPTTWMHEARLTIVPAVFGDPSPAYAPANLELWFLLLMAPLRSDYLAGVGQLPLAALAATAIAAAVREAGAGRTPALAAALAFLLIPEVHGQVPTAMTDLGLAAFLLASLPFSLRGDIVACAAALGLAAGTKYAGAVLALPFAIAAGIAIARRRPRPVARDVLAAVGVGVATGGFWYLRNLALTGNPLYPVAVPGLPLAAHYGGAEMRAWEYHLPVADVAALGALLLGAGVAYASAAAVGLARAWRGRELGLAAALVATFWLVVPYQESRFLFAAFGVAAIAMGRTAGQPPKLLGWGIAGVAIAGGLLHHPAARVLPIVVAAALAAAAFAVIAHRAAAARLPARAGIAAAAAAVVALTIALAAGHRSAQAHPRPYTVGDELDGAWTWVEANVRDARVAYTGTNLAFPLAGRRLGNHVTYVNVAGGAGDRLHDFPPGARAGAEPAPYRDGASAARWLDNLRAARAQVLFVAAMYPIVRRTIAADADGFPIERAWADARPDVFRLAYASPAARIYALVTP
jgi:hypothetical protein